MTAADNQIWPGVRGVLPQGSSAEWLWPWNWCFHDGGDTAQDGGRDRHPVGVLVGVPVSVLMVLAEGHSRRAG